MATLQTRSSKKSHFPEPDPDRIAAMRKQGIEPLKININYDGTDLGPTLRAAARKSKAHSNPDPSLTQQPATK